MHATDQPESLPCMEVGLGRWSSNELLDHHDLLSYRVFSRNHLSFINCSRRRTIKNEEQTASCMSDNMADCAGLFTYRSFGHNQGTTSVINYQSVLTTPRNMTSRRRDFSRTRTYVTHSRSFYLLTNRSEYKTRFPGASDLNPQPRTVWIQNQTLATGDICGSHSGDTDEYCLLRYQAE
jgi:hypothetical protein